MPFKSIVYIRYSHSAIILCVPSAISIILASYGLSLGEGVIASNNAIAEKCATTSSNIAVRIHHAEKLVLANRNSDANNNHVTLRLRLRVS